MVDDNVLALVPETDVAWAAGLFEGEGTVGFYKQVVIGLAMTDRDVVERFASILDMKVYSMKNKVGRKVMYHAKGGRYHAEKALQLFKSYLGKRRLRQFEEALAYRIVGPQCRRMMDGNPPICQHGKPMLGKNNKWRCRVRLQEWRRSA
jgi:hypothetical protein